MRRRPDSQRGTGRTKAMIQQVIEATMNHRQVFIVVHAPFFINYILDMIAEYKSLATRNRHEAYVQWSQHRARISVIPDDGNMKYRLAGLNREHTPVFYDHACWM